MMAEPKAKLFRVWETAAPGMWVVQCGVYLYEAWAWLGQSTPPEFLHESGYRFRELGTEVSNG